MKPRTLWWGLLAVTLAGISTAISVKYIAHLRSGLDLPILGEIHDFALMDQTGAKVTRQTLSGNTWVADFIYTQCDDQCPLMSRKMETIQSLLPNEAKVQLVSISVNPTHDTPGVLLQYAKRYHANSARWRFLTGPPDAIQALSENFRLSTGGKPPTAPVVNHSNRFIVVDGRSCIRGYYDGTDNLEIRRLMKDLSALSARDSGQ